MINVERHIRVARESRRKNTNVGRNMTLHQNRRDWLRLIVSNNAKLRGKPKCCSDNFAVGPRLAVDDQRNAVRMITCDVKNPATGLVRAQVSCPIAARIELIGLEPERSEQIKKNGAADIEELTGSLHDPT